MNRLTVVLFVLLFVACGEGTHFNRLNPNKDQLIFGSFYGFCGPSEQCIEIYALQEGKLYEDQNDQYPQSSSPNDFNFEQLSQDKFELAEDMFDAIPGKLLATESTTFGCPDCSDGGGVYIEIKTGTQTRIFLIDNFKHNIPEYLHPLVDKVREKVDVLE
jgi:hypothetical protein